MVYIRPRLATAWELKWPKWKKRRTRDPSSSTVAPAVTAYDKKNNFHAGGLSLDNERGCNSRQSKSPDDDHEDEGSNENNTNAIYTNDGRDLVSAMHDSDTVLYEPRIWRGSVDVEEYSNLYGGPDPTKSTESSCGAVALVDTINAVNAAG